jgi:hypothetical protein
MRHYIAKTDGTGSQTVNLVAQDDETRAMAKGDRIIFYQIRGEGDEERGTFVAWGEVDRLSADGDQGTVHLKALHSLKRRVPFADLRGDPRRDRGVDVQSVNAEVVNLVLSRSRK